MFCVGSNTIHNPIAREKQISPYVYFAFLEHLTRFNLQQKLVDNKFKCYIYLLKYRNFGQLKIVLAYKLIYIYLTQTTL